VRACGDDSPRLICDCVPFRKDPACQQHRADFNTYARDTGERVAVLETDLHGLMGNGQPGRVPLPESAVAKLSQWRWWVVGADAGRGGVVAILAWIATEMHNELDILLDRENRWILRQSWQH